MITMVNGQRWTICSICEQICIYRWSKSTHKSCTSAHHPEFFAPGVQLNPNSKTAPKRADATAMDTISIAEMCADWAAMSEELGTGLLEWVDKNIDVKWRFSQYQKRSIYKLLGICLELG